MKVFKSLRGLSNQWLVFLPVAASAVAIWLPLHDPVLALLISFATLVSAFLLLSFLPKPAIAVSCDDFSIASSQSTMTFDELTSAELVDCGQIEGFSLILRDSLRNARPMAIPFSQIQGSFHLLEHTRRNSERAGFLYKTIPLGSPMHWLIALAISALLAGSARLVLEAIA